MKILYYGGQKSGKSLLAEQRALVLAGESKPYYIATYDHSYGDLEMDRRIQRHQEQRKSSFHTIEESREILSMIDDGESYLIDCMSMWILNSMDSDIESLLDEIDAIGDRKANIVFVLNDVNSGIIPIDSMSREYVDRSGIVGQRLVQICDEVYEVKLGLEVRLK